LIRSPLADSAGKQHVPERVPVRHICLLAVTIDELPYEEIWEAVGQSWYRYYNRPAMIMITSSFRWSATPSFPTGSSRPFFCNNTCCKSRPEWPEFIFGSSSCSHGTNEKRRITANGHHDGRWRCRLLGTKRTTGKDPISNQQHAAEAAVAKQPNRALLRSQLRSSLDIRDGGESSSIRKQQLLLGRTT
jgi:hypothetical protein